MAHSPAEPAVLLVAAETLTGTAREPVLVERRAGTLPSLKHARPASAPGCADKDQP